MIHPVKNSSAEMVVQSNNAGKTSLPKLTNGQVLMAKVLTVPSADGLMQLLVNGQKITARTSMAFAPGQQIELRVFLENNATIFKLLTSDQQVSTSQTSSLIRFFARNTFLPDLNHSRMDGVKTLLEQLALRSEHADKDFLPRLIEKGGLTLEKNLATLLNHAADLPDLKNLLDLLQKGDLKAGLLKNFFAAGSLQADSPGSGAHFLDTLENFQLINQNTQDSGRFLLPFPIFSDRSFQFGQLLIDTGRSSDSSDKDRDKVIRISFLLNMSRLGPLRADFSVLKKEITGRFLTGDETICQYIQSLLPELKTRLAAIDYTVHQVECQVAVKAADIQDSCLIDALVQSDEQQVLNIVV